MLIEQNASGAPTEFARSDLFVSVVAPLRNAVEYLESFVDDLVSVLEPSFKDYEIVLVDDSSHDSTVAHVERLQKKYRNLQLYGLARSVGLHSAFVVGIEHAIGDVVVTMDPTTDPPARILDLVDCFYAGHEIVYGVRRDHDQSTPTKLYERLARRFFLAYRSITGEDLPVDLCSLRLLTRRVVNTFTQNRDRYNLFPVIAAFTGIAYTTLPYSRIRRAGATWDVSYWDGVGRALGLLLLSSKRPLRWMTGSSLVGALLSLGYAIYVLLVHVFAGNKLAEGWASLSLQIAGLFFVLFVILAVMSEYLLRIFVHTQNRPAYIVNKESSSLVLARKSELNVARPPSRSSARD